MQKFFVKYADQYGRIRENFCDYPSLEDLKREFLSKDLFILEATIQEKSLKESVFSFLNLHNKVSLQELMEFSKLFRTLVKGGLPISDSLEVVTQDMKNELFCRSLKTVQNDIDAGISFSGALGKHPNVFPEIFVKSIMAGEKAGALDEILNRLVMFYKNSISIRRKIFAAMIYPTILMAVSFFAVLYMLIGVVPEFTDLFRSLNVPLPVYTAIVLSISGFFSDYFLYLAVLFTLIVIVTSNYLKTPAGTKFFHGIKLKIPVLSKLEEKYSLSQFSRMLATLVEGGIPLVESLKVVLQSIGNVVIKDRLNPLSELLNKGDSFSASLRKIPEIPLALTKMVHVGEESGNLPEMLNGLADHYDEEIDELTTTLTSLIEPALFLFLALIVGSIIIALLLPVLSAASNIR
ncbi:MAG: type II secretion system F family protein [Candidatus Riflebacteria bacterium]|nr:type II secretion system F family protein [Candidatus Riflebacteria bacterium]